MISCEDKQSVALYEINKDLLSMSQKLDRFNKKRLSISNLGVFFSYVRNGAFSRIFRRVFIKRNLSKEEYCLKEYTRFPNAKVVVYTCIWGKYDNILEPYFANPNIEYRIITDQPVPAESIWKKQDIPLNFDLKGKTATEINRFFKMKPHLLFQKYDYSIYVDGNIRVVTDLMPLIADFGENILGIHSYQVDCIYNMKNAIIAGKKAKRKDVNSQIKRYKKEGFPKHFGAFECNVLVRKHNDATCIKIMNDWYDEFEKTESKRDQLSLPYVIWKNGYDSNIVFSLGYHVRENPRFRVISYHNLNKKDY